MNTRRPLTRAAGHSLFASQTSRVPCTAGLIRTGTVAATWTAPTFGASGLVSEFRLRIPRT